MFKKLTHKLCNSTIGMLMMSLLVDDDQRARGYLADARGQFRGNLQLLGFLPLKRYWG
jgi:hypothetical protein